MKSFKNLFWESLSFQLAIEVVLVPVTLAGIIRIKEWQGRECTADYSDLAGVHKFDIS